MPQFEAAVTVNCTHETVFDFLVRPANRLQLLHPEAGMSFLNVPESIELGSRLEYQLEGFGPVQRVLHEVTEFDRPRRFVEMQVKGPLGHWRHEHLFESEGNGRMVFVDRIEFEPPGGLAGFVVTEARILDTLKVGFDHRHQELKKLLEQGKP